jgi:AAHS family 4-hydroxybenzoate transporter-like MFS transporter
LLNENPFSGFQYLIFALCFLIVLLDGFDTASIGYIAPSLVKEWGVSLPALAPVLSAALFGRKRSTLTNAMFCGHSIERLRTALRRIVGNRVDQVTSFYLTENWPTLWGW